MANRYVEDLCWGLFLLSVLFFGGQEIYYSVRNYRNKGSVTDYHIEQTVPEGLGKPENFYYSDPNSSRRDGNSPDLMENYFESGRGYRG